MQIRSEVANRQTMTKTVSFLAEVTNAKRFPCDKTERLLKVSTSHVDWESSNVSEMVSWLPHTTKRKSFSLH